MTRTPMHGSGGGADEPTDLRTDDFGDSEITFDGGVIKVSGRLVMVEDRHLPSWLEIEFEGGEQRAGQFARVEVRNGAPEVVEVRFRSGPGQREIRQGDLRMVEVSALLKLLGGFAFEVRSSSDGGVVRHGHPDSDFYQDSLEAITQARRSTRARRVTPQLLDRVAAVYRENIDDRPVQAVMKRFDVGNRMAAEYVMRAREANLLPPTSPGKKKA